MKIRTRDQWIHHLAALRVPEHAIPNDYTLANVLLDVLVDEQARLGDESLAVLAGVVAVLMERGTAGLVASHVDAEGRPLYTEAQVAEHLGVPLERVRAECDALLDTHGDDAGIARIDPGTIYPLN